MLTATNVQNLLGVQFENKKMDLVINPQYYDWITYHPDDNINHVVYFYFYFYFYNNGQEAIKLSDCKLYRASFQFNGDGSLSEVYFGIY